MRALGFILVTVVGVALAASTAARVHLWTDGERLLWADAARKAPEKPRPWVNLGNQYGRNGLDELAEDAYTHATELAENPARLSDERAYGYSLAQANVAQLEVKHGDRAAGIARLRKIVSRYPVTSVQQLLIWYERQDTPTP